MYKQDIKGSIAHATMLGKQNIIPKEDSDKIVAELKNILKDIEDGKVEFEKMCIRDRFSPLLLNLCITLSTSLKLPFTKVSRACKSPFLIFINNLFFSSLERTGSFDAVSYTHLCFQFRFKCSRSFGEYFQRC